MGRVRSQILTPEKITLIHEALKLLAESDSDYATEKNNQGFNLWDTERGHELAKKESLGLSEAEEGRRIIKKYWNQIPGEIYCKLFN